MQCYLDASCRRWVSLGRQMPVVWAAENGRYFPSCAVCESVLVGVRGLGVRARFVPLTYEDVGWHFHCTFLYMAMNTVQ